MGTTLKACMRKLKSRWFQRRPSDFRLLSKVNGDVPSAFCADPRYSVSMHLPYALDLCLRDVRVEFQRKKWPVNLVIGARTPSFDRTAVEPGTLRAVAVFMFRYGVHRRRRPLEFHINFQETPVPCVLMSVNAAVSDLSFEIDELSDAHEARNALVQELNRIAAKGWTVQISVDSNGWLVFQVPLRQLVSVEQNWIQIEKTLEKDTVLLSTCPLSEGVNRVYEKSGVIYKVELSGYPSPKALSLAEEYRVLRHLEGLSGIPQPLGLEAHSDFLVLKYRKIEGIGLKHYLKEAGMQRSAWVRCIAELSAILDEMHRRGVVHRDLRSENILVDPEGGVHLIDFDQAVAGVYRGTKQIDLSGEGSADIPACIPVKHLIDELGLREEYANVCLELRKAWQIGAASDASSPGRKIAYHRWLFGEEEFFGERDWHLRWSAIHAAIGHLIPNARVLDLGCNMGLTSIHCMLYGARQAVAVDAHQDILDAARTVAGALSVPVEFMRANLDQDDCIDRILGKGPYDLVIALSVFHWLKQERNAFRLLQMAPTVLYEGHGPHSAQTDLLRSAGFEQIRLVGYSERLRGLYLARRGA